MSGSGMVGMIYRAVLACSVWATVYMAVSCDTLDIPMHGMFLCICLCIHMYLHIAFQQDQSVSH